MRPWAVSSAWSQAERSVQGQGKGERSLRLPESSSRVNRSSRPFNDFLHQRGRRSCILTPRDRGAVQRKECPTPLGAGGSGRSFPGARRLFRPPPCFASRRTRGRGRWVGAGENAEAGRAQGRCARWGFGRAHVRACVSGRGPHTLCARRMSGPAEPGLRTRWRKVEAAVNDRMLRPRNRSSGL